MSEERDWKRVAQKIVVLAPPESVWRALIDQESLKIWLAEHAVLEPEVGGKFAIWGHGTFDSAIPLESAGKVVEFEAPTKLGLEFTMIGAFARVTISIAATKEGSTVLAEYLLPNNSESMPWYLTQDHAILFLYNLRSFVETGKPCLLPDEPADGRTPKVHIVVSAEPSNVFAALTVP